MNPLLITAALLITGVASATDFHVSPTGDDGNTGLGAGDDQALRTIQAGVNKLQPGDTLLIHGGVYRESVTFPASGAEGRPITIRPFDSEKVTVTGCDVVEGWTLQDAEKGIWKAPMPWTLGLGRNQVFAGGQVMIEARFPNEPGEDLGMYVSDLSPLWPTFGKFTLPKETVSEQPGRIVSDLLAGQPDDYWKSACYYGIHYEGWAAQTGIIERSKSGEISVGDRTRTWWFGASYGSGYGDTEGRGMIVGHMNALDRPGEWHWQDNTLYFIPPDGEEPRNVEAKRRQVAFDLSGQQHIRIEGLSVRAGSMRLDESSHCVVDGCDLAYISHYTRHYDIGQIENGRNTIKSGETGIFVGGHDNSFLNCGVRFSAGAGFYLRGYHHTIHNCLIDEISYTSHYLNAITDAVSDFPEYENFLVGGHVITFNTMRNAGRHFFNFHGNGTSTQSRDRAPMDYMATLFAHNHLYNGMLQTKDAGFLTGYYCSGGTLNDLNSQVVYNVMHDCYDLAAMRWGILGIVYLDAGTCDVDLHHNLLWAAPGSLQRGLWYNTMCVDVHERDNVFHPLFERTSADLTAADFPDGVPFRFGHDFDNPPALPVWPQIDRSRIEAESSPSHSDGVTPSESGLSGITDGAWFSLGKVDFDQNWQSAIMRFASANAKMNTDRSGRTAPRHTKATDPLVMEVSSNDGLEERVRRQWTFMYNVNDGAWIRFNQVPLGEGYRRVRFIYGNDAPGARWAEVRLDSVDGQLVGRVDLRQTDRKRGGRIQIYAQAVGELSVDAAGTRDVFLVFHSEDGLPVGEFEYFRFEQYRGNVALQPNEVKMELRLDSPQGEKIGEFYPRATGGETAFRDLVAKLEPARGTHELFVSVRSASADPVGFADWVSLEKAVQPVDYSGVGVPPLMRDGKMVLPDPTNRPCARPADRFPARSSAAPTRPRPIYRLARLKSAPEIDGMPDAWTGSDAAVKMTLAESFDGSPSAGPASTAWLGYDEDALYVTVRNTVSNAASLVIGDHTWGGTDAMEIALQDGLGAKPGPILNLYGWPDGHFVSTDQAGAPADVVARLGQSVNYAARVGEGEWTCEWRIPFAACGFTPKSAPSLLCNLGVRKMAENAWVIWRGTGDATYRVGNAGIVCFADEVLAAGIPTDGLQVRLDASAEGAVVTDKAGKVSLWKDTSGNSLDAKQVDPRFRPIYAPEGINGKPALQFREELFTRMEVPDLAEGKITASIFAVVSNPEPGLAVNHDPRIFTASDGKEYDYICGLACTVPGMEVGGPRIMTFTGVDRWAKHVRVGCFSPNVQTFFKGHIGEILVYTRALSLEEQERIRAYLTSKWELGM